MKAFAVGNNFPLTGELIERLSNVGLQIPVLASPDDVPAGFELLIMEARPPYDRVLQTVGVLGKKQAEEGLLVVITMSSDTPEDHPPARKLKKAGAGLLLSQDNGVIDAICGLEDTLAEATIDACEVVRSALNTIRAQYRIKVICVEDERSVAQLLRDGLELFGIWVGPIYGSAEDAFEAILAGKPSASGCDMMLFDIRLPGMTGLELATKLRAAGEHRPILIVSAYQPPSPSHLRSLNAHFMPKPFDFVGIVGVIQELVG